MCRFLIVKGKEKFDPKPHLESFAKLCKNSKEFQGDGWGFCFLDNDWKLYRSEKPIWEETNIFEIAPKTRMLVAHARSSFKDRGAVLEFNQPFLDNGIVFVFNGELKGVRLKIDGKIGSQKIFNLVKKYLGLGLEASLREVKQKIEDNSNYVRALNVGVISKDKAAVLCKYGEQPEYFTLHYYIGNRLSIICSEPYGTYEFKKMQNDEIKVIR